MVNETSQPHKDLYQLEDDKCEHCENGTAGAEYYVTTAEVRVEVAIYDKKCIKKKEKVRHLPGYCP